MIRGSRILLAVTGGVAAYKAADLCSRLVQAGAVVDVLMTAGARRFVQPLTFNALTRRPVHTDPWEPWTAERAGHVGLAAEADLLLVAPASANAIARVALGLAPDLLGMVALSTAAPLLVAPAMEHHMWRHPATAAHVETLRARGATIVGPDAGRLASGATGEGRLAPTEAIIDEAAGILARNGPLAGRSVVVTAGGTHEPIDPVRFVGNRSSGRMGIAIARALRDRGAAVRLVLGPTSLPAPGGISVVPVETALEMRAAVERAVADAEALVMAAAVADFRPTAAADRKLKKHPGEDGLDLRLVRNPDILAGIERPGLVKIGFAAETEDLIANAAAKLRAKGLAMIVANDAVATIGAEESQAVFLTPDAPPEPQPSMPKDRLAEVIADRVARLLARGGAETRS
jgi:phosphopantothenoylcysteine decarboxylase / phosphopantothenate---cysteine ligase